MIGFLQRLICATWLLAGSAAHALNDGPYVFKVGSEHEAHWICAGQVQVIKVPNGRIEPACGTLLPFALTEHPAAPDAIAAPKRWAALSDVHGQAALLLRLLTAHGLIDANGHWAWGDGALIVVGDVLDRGPEQIEALWTLYRLATEARAQGGRVELLLGNHEIMVLSGDLRYLHPKYLTVAEQLGRPYQQLLASDSELGAWLRTRATALKMGKTLFVHGGLHPRFAESSLNLREINAGVRARLGSPSEMLLARLDADALLGSEGPTWYRGYFEPNAATPLIG